MSNTIAYVDNQTLTNIANAVRDKTGTNGKMLLSDIPDKIRNIDGIIPSGSIEIVENGNYNVISYANANVSVVNQDYEGALTALGVTKDLTDGIEALTTYSNEITGKNDTTLSNAVASLADGYGSESETDYDDVVLPEEYQRVEYIESSGTQFIDLPFGFYPTDTISMRSSIDRSMSEDKFMVCPSQWNNNNNRFGLCGIGGSKSFIFAYGSLKTSQTAYAFSRTNENDGDLHDFCYKDGVFRIVDLKRASGIGGMTFGAESYILRLFYGYNSNTSGKIAYFVHEKADGRKVALFACYRKSDGVIGMYDVENDVFYTNDGSGDFAKGADI